jgi:CAAX prenyl protease-like protein
LACVVPFAMYLLCTTAAAKAGENYPLGYGVAVLIVAAVCLVLLPGQGIIKPHARIFPAVGVGVVGICLWITISAAEFEATFAGYLPSMLAPTPRMAWNPFEQMSNPLAIGLFLAVRLFGLVILVPLVEELFWRGFLARWLIAPDWQRVPLGKFTPMSFAAVTVLFTLAHPEWFAAAAYCALLNGFLYYTRDLWSCIVAHGVSNFLLAVFVIFSGWWWLW